MEYCIAYYHLQHLLRKKTRHHPAIRLIHLLPAFSLGFYLNDAAGRNVVYEVLCKIIGHLRKGRIVAKKQHRVGFIWQTADDAQDVQRHGFVDVLFFLYLFPGKAKRFGEKQGGRQGAFGGAAYDQVGFDTAFGQHFGHRGRIVHAALIERSAKISDTRVVPARFGVANEEEGAHGRKLD